MADRFWICVEHILQNEGGYVNDPKDPGGETNFGISKRSYPNLDIKNLTREDAATIYHDDYWSRMQCDYIQDINVALQLFDFGVNAGVRRAVKLAQKVAGVYQDGIIGPDTINAINSTHDFANQYVEERIQYYKDLAIKNPSLMKFLGGWTARAKRTVIK